MIVDLIVIAIIALSTFLGYKRGLIKSLLKIFSFVIAIILAFTLCTPVTNFIINKTEIDEKIEQTIIKKIVPQENVDGKMEEDQVEIDDNTVNLLKVDKVMMVKNLANVISVKIIKILSLISIFIVVKIILLIIMKLTDFITKIPVMKQLNELGGIIYGCIQGLFLIFLVFGLIFVMTPIISAGFVNAISSAPISGFLYNHNILIKLLF